LEYLNVPEMKTKAQRWDELKENIDIAYRNYEGDLCDIGEMAARAFGYL